MFDKDFLKDINIMYVEDDESIRNEINSIFSNIFKNVFCASNGIEALEIYNKLKSEINIIVSDIIMPDMDGLELLSEIKKIDKNLPIIFTTAFSDAQYMLEGFKRGVDDYFIKPIDLEKLILKIEKLVKKEFTNRDINILQNEINDYLQTINKVAIVYVFDENEKIIYINDFYKELSKYDENKIIGKRYEDIFHKDIAKELIYNQLNVLLNENKPWKGKLKYHSKDEKPFYTNCDIIPFFNDGKRKFISINFITTEEENNRREFKKKVLYSFNETKKIFKVAQDKINELNLELSKYKNYEEKEKVFNKLKEENYEYLQKIKNIEDKIKNIRRKHEVFTHDVNVKIKEISLSTESMKDFTLKSDKRIDYIKREIIVREQFIEKITEELEIKKRKVKDLQDVLLHRDSQVEDIQEIDLVKDY